MRRALLVLLLAGGAHFSCLAELQYESNFNGLSGFSEGICGQPPRTYPFTGTFSEVSVSTCSMLSFEEDCRSVSSVTDLSPPAGKKSFYCAGTGGTSGPFTAVAIPGACDAQLDVERSLSTEVTLNPAGAVASVCFQGCQFDLGTAANYTIGEEVWRVGSWIGSGDACSGDPAAQVDPGDGGTPESCGGDDEDPCTTEVETDLDDKLAEILAASLAQRSGTNSTHSAIGDFFSLPTWIRTAFDRGSTDCKLHIAIPAGSVLSPVASAIANTDVCGVQVYADTYGNWFFGFCTVLWSWSIVTGARIEET